MIALKEKGLAFESIYIDMGKFEQHDPSFIAINPDGQVAVLDHDGAIITHTTVINEYLEDAFPDSPHLRPEQALGRARMRYWNKFTDEHVMECIFDRDFKSLHVDGGFVAVFSEGLKSSFETADELTVHVIDDALDCVHCSPGAI